MKLRLVRLLTLLLMVLLGRLVSLFPSSLLAAVGLAGCRALQLAGLGASRVGYESSIHPQDPTAAHQADLTVLLIPLVPSAQLAGVTVFLQAALSHVPHAAVTAPGGPQVTTGHSQGLLSGSCVMAWPQGWLALEAGRLEAYILVPGIPGTSFPFLVPEESGGQLNWFIQKEGALGGLWMLDVLVWGGEALSVKRPFKTVL